MEEMDLEEDVLDVVDQEASTIVDILCEQRDNVLQQIFALVDARTREQLQHLPNNRESISGLVDYFRTSDQHTCRHFLDIIWSFCENIPLELDIRIVNLAGSTAGKFCLIQCSPHFLATGQCNSDAPIYLLYDTNNLELMPNYFNM